ncbi:MAG: hypothetical protein JJW03_05710 [Desulfosarcina sp.]|nr:hypothetical protein [Desulfobacterales bacterium]
MMSDLDDPEPYVVPNQKETTLIEQPEDKTPVKPGKSKEITFTYWVPVEIYKEITSLSATLRYSLSK